MHNLDVCILKNCDSRCTYHLSGLYYTRLQATCTFASLSKALCMHVGVQSPNVKCMFVHKFNSGKVRKVWCGVTSSSSMLLGQNGTVACDATGFCLE